MILSGFESLNSKIDKLFGKVEELKKIMKEKVAQTDTPQENDQFNNNDNPDGGNK